MAAKAIFQVTSVIQIVVYVDLVAGPLPSRRAAVMLLAGIAGRSCPVAAMPVHAIRVGIDDTIIFGNQTGLLHSVNALADRQYLHNSGSRIFHGFQPVPVCL